MCVARHPSEDAAANPNASGPEPKSRGLLRTRRCRQVVAVAVGCSWGLEVIVRSRLFRTRRSKHEAIDDIVPLSYRPRWATMSIRTALVQFR